VTGTGEERPHPRVSPDRSAGRTTARWALGLALLAALVRTALVPVHGFAPGRTFTPDSVPYLELAQGLVDRGSFGRTAGTGGSGPENPGRVEVFRTPGYPVLIAALMGLHVPVVPSLLGVQIVLDAAGVALAFLLARTFLPLGWAIAVGLTQVFDVARIVYANMVMSDVVFTFLIAAALYLVAGAGRGRSAGRAALAGIALSLATAVRPIGVLVFLPAAAFLAMRRAGLRAVALVTAGALLFPVAWTLRNGAKTGVWALSNAFDYNLCLVAAAKVKARAEGIGRAEAERTLIGEAVASTPGANVAARTAAFRRIGWRTLALHPGAALHEAVTSGFELALAGERRNVLRLLGLPAGRDDVPALGEGRRDPAVAAAALAGRSPLEIGLVGSQAVWNAVLWIGAVLGVVHLVRRRRWPELVLLGMTVVVVLGPSLVVANGRMRMPVAAVVALLAAYGFGKENPEER
jgi:hypothetical protein